MKKLSSAGRVSLAAAVVLSMAIAGYAFAGRNRLDSSPTASTGWSSNGTTTSTTQTVTATPGPIQAGGAGISTDGGVFVTGPGAGTGGAVRAASFGRYTDSTTGFSFSAAGQTDIYASNVLQMSWATTGTIAPVLVTSTVASNSKALEVSGFYNCGASSGQQCMTTTNPTATYALGAVASAALTGTPASGTGITANNTSTIRTWVHKVTVINTALAAAATSDVTLHVTPVNSRINRVVADVTQVFTGGALSAMTVMCGNAAGGNQYLLANSVFTAQNTWGDIVAEMGAGLVDATRADFGTVAAGVPGAITIQCRFTCTGANCNAATQGSVTFYVEGVTYP